MYDMEWTRTRSVLADLKKFLICGICKGYLKDPCTLDNCDHNFCRKCIEESLGHDSKCPECGSFSWMKDLRVNNQLTTTVNMSLKLQSLIGDNIEVKKNALQKKSKPLSLSLKTSPPPGDQEMEKSSEVGSVSTSRLQETNSKMIKQQNRVVESVMEFENETNHTAKVGNAAALKGKGNKKVKQRKQSTATVKDVSTDEESERESGYPVRRHNKMTKKPTSLSLCGRKVRKSETEENHCNSVKTTRVKKNVHIRNSSGFKQASVAVERDVTDVEFDSEESNPSTDEAARESSTVTTVRGNGRMTRGRGTADTDSQSDINHFGDTKTRKENTNMEKDLQKSHREQGNVSIQSRVLSGFADAKSDSEANRVSIAESGKEGLRRHSNNRKFSAVEEHNKITIQQSITKAIGNNTESDSEGNRSSTVPKSKTQRTSMKKASEATESDTEANDDIMETSKKTYANLNENSTKSVSNIPRRPNNVPKKRSVQRRRDSGMCGDETDEEATKEEENVKQRKPARNLRRRKMTDSTQSTAMVINTDTDPLLQSDSETNHARTNETVPTKGQSADEPSADELGNINEGDVIKEITVDNTTRSRPSGQQEKSSKRVVTKRDSISEKICRKASEKNVLKTYSFRNKINPNPKVKSNSSKDRFDFSQQEDPFHFSFTDAEGTDSNDDEHEIDGIDYDNHVQENKDHDNDCNNDYDDYGTTKSSLRSMDKASRNKISKDRRTGRYNDVEPSSAVLQNRKSKRTAQGTIEKVKFTHLKDRSTNRDQPDQNTIEKGKKKTSSTRPGLMLNAADDEYKENNDTLNIKRRRVRSKNTNIQQYFTPLNNKDTNEDSEATIPAKRRKLTSSSEILRNPNTSSQCSQSQNTVVSSQCGRNIKGETPLHLAAIKGDLALALELINEGADPNIKDFAGWTPLHEACNHGHVEIVELLLDHNALINIPGHDNDTPLHDAVANGRLKVAKLLVSRGAVLSARNKQGLLPMHYAVTKAMKAALTARGVSSEAKPINEIENVKKYTVICRESQVILGTALKTQDQLKLKKCIKQLGGTLVDKFDESVTHIVTSVNENGHCPRTIKNLFGILTGKWIVSFQWINECLGQCQWLDEDDYEVQGTVGKTCNGAKKARLNNLQQMPRLFDGCSFFLRGVFNPPTPSRQDIIKLITAGGGKLLHREPKVKDDDLTSLPSSPVVTSLSREPKVAYHAPANSSLSCCTEFILYDSTSCDQLKIVYSPVLCTAPVTWLMDCISSFQLLDIPDV